MSTYVKNFVFLVIFDTCDVVYNLSVSLLPPIVLDNLFDKNLLMAVMPKPQFLTYFRVSNFKRKHICSEHFLSNGTKACFIKIQISKLSE